MLPCTLQLRDVFETVISMSLGLPLLLSVSASPLLTLSPVAFVALACLCDFAAALALLCSRLRRKVSSAARLDLTAAEVNRPIIIFIIILVIAVTVAAARCTVALDPSLVGELAVVRVLPPRSPRRRPHPSTR
jgi:hypothetical protein